MTNFIFKTSIIVSLWFSFTGCLLAVNENLVRSWRASRICRLMKAVNYFIFGEYFYILENSHVARWTVGSYRKFEKRTAAYRTSSRTSEAFSGIKGDFSVSALKATGIILISSAAVNLALYFLISGKITAIGLVIRGGVLAVGLLCMAVNADWGAVKRTSVVLRIFG